MLYYEYQAGNFTYGLSFNNSGNVLFSALNALVMGAFMNSIGLGVGTDILGKFGRILIIAIGVILVFMGFANFGLWFNINISQLNVHLFTSNTSDGIQFFVGNLDKFTIVWGISLAFMGETPINVSG